MRGLLTITKYIYNNKTNYYFTIHCFKSCLLKIQKSLNPLTSDAPCQKWLVLISCSIETKLPWVLKSSETWHTKNKLSFEIKLTIPRLPCDFSQIFQKLCRGLRHGFWKNWWKLIFIRWRARSLRWFYHRRNWKKRQARQAQHEQNLLRNVDDEMEDFFDLRSQERGSDSDVELYASEEEEESDASSDEESAAEESRPNALQWSS